MNILIDPPRPDWPELLSRPALDQDSLRQAVAEIIQDVRVNGDKALAAYNKRFEGVEDLILAVSQQELAAAEKELDPLLKESILQAAQNIERFHRGQLILEEPVETQPGVLCWRRAVGIERVGLYIPGGNAPLFSTVLMLAIPARIAGCRQVVLCTPVQPDGRVHPAVLFAAMVAKVSTVFKTGGAQAIAAMAYGTATVPRVYKIFGPGNQYVTCAKQLVQKDVAIDMPAGPSEVCVLADETANPEFVAADLLSQAEHGADSQVLLVTSSALIAERVAAAVLAQAEGLPKRALALAALEKSRFVVMSDPDLAIELVNEYAAEHLILAVRDPEPIAERIINAGSVFLGHYSPESVGDYASGTNHTLPTNGAARAYSGVSVDSFVKKISYQQLTPAGLQNISRTVETMAKAEGLDAHALAVSIRLRALEQSKPE